VRSISRGRVGLRVGKLLLSAIAMAAPIGAFSADWNSTHVFNPKWTPHAEFHNAQTITLSVVTAGLTEGQGGRSHARCSSNGGSTSTMPIDHVQWTMIGASTPPVTRRCSPTSRPSTTAANTSMMLPVVTVVKA